ncbi:MULTISPECIES: DUF4762 family protein [Yersinia]|uniref:DUF4762 domain-containing protein n=2 Tax=Yersinia bercovieri TaxID=634 RepID=A0A2G4U0Q4_YERBE|nr:MULTISPECIES: DUF4762 family protein [Yersinia]MCB5303339.1 DUF4762 domain-containing protein [Yersinia bercovieri]MDN0104796.1 DUF4762 family protein [Yersinia bercovieri]PHZ26891.1 DUF4762 domain-containing protein [Yersinia bercovieri]QDW34599.1 DUF4762 domain-containing protein [Yersinia sp. KBS0713]QKJ07262.1 DUF4762 family protein [Yersinia bercovieri ATCC 43970]
MKKMNLADANTIVGGTGTTCKDTFEWLTGSTTLTCQAITTCTDKHGKVVSRTVAPSNVANCK